MEELYQQNAKLVYYFLYAQCHDAHLAEDLTQETFLQAIKSIHRYDGSCKISVWLCQIAKHLLYHYWEKHKREFTMTEEEWQIVGETQVEQQALAHYELTDVLSEMKHLPEQMRKVMYLRISGELSFREIGELMGRSESWARVNFYRAKERLLKQRQERRGSYED